MRICGFSILLFLLCGFEGINIAQEAVYEEDRDSIPSQLLEEVVVTANRYGLLQFKSPEAIRALEQSDIQNHQIRTSPEALALTPGVFIQKTNHGGGSPFVRGLTGNQTLLLIDGIRLSNATMRYGPNQYLNTIDVFGLEKFEVLRGDGSVQYGSDAIGGTVHAFTYRPDTSSQSMWMGKMLGRLATQDMEQSLHGRIQYSNRRVALTGGITGRNFGDLVGGDTTGVQAPSGYREFDFDLKARIVLSPGSDLTLAWQSVHQRDVPVYHKVALEDYAVNKMDPQKRGLAYIRLHQILGKGLFKSAVLTASMQNSEEGRTLQRNGSSMQRSENDRVRSLGFSAETFTSNNRFWSANTGFEIYNDLVNSKRTDTDLSTDTSIMMRGLYPDGSSMTGFAGFTLHTFDLKHWNISAGARYNAYIIEVEDENLGYTKLSPGALVGNLAILRKLNEKSNVFISLNSGFRAPNIDDLGTLGIVDFRYETPNLNLKPEYSLQYQLGYKLQGRSLKGEIFLYRNELYNLIARSRLEGDSIEGYPVYQKENVGRAFIQGIETDWQWEINQAWALNGTITYTYGHNITKDEPMRRIPPLFGRLAVEYRLKSWMMNAEWQAAGKQERLSSGDIDDNRIPEGGTPAWNVINLNTSYAWRSLTVGVSLRNLLNQDYRYHGSGINGYGRSAILTVILTL